MTAVRHVRLSSSVNTELGLKTFCLFSYLIQGELNAGVGGVCQMCDAPKRATRVITPPTYLTAWNSLFIRVTGCIEILTMTRLLLDFRVRLDSRRGVCRHLVMYSNISRRVWHTASRDVSDNGSWVHKGLTKSPSWRWVGFSKCGNSLLFTNFTGYKGLAPSTTPSYWY